MLRKGGGGAVDTESDREGGGGGEKKQKHLSAPEPVSYAWPLTHRKPLIQIRDKVVSSAQLTCLERRAPLRSEIDNPHSRHGYPRSGYMVGAPRARVEERNLLHSPAR